MLVIFSAIKMLFEWSPRFYIWAVKHLFSTAVQLPIAYGWRLLNDVLIISSFFLFASITALTKY